MESNKGLNGAFEFTFYFISPINVDYASRCFVSWLSHLNSTNRLLGVLGSSYKELSLKFVKLRQY